MSVRIGHASIDERGKAKGGAAGDQTGREVCIRTWYSKPWKVLLRAKDEAVAERMAAACEAGCRNNSIGYDQNQRNTLHTLSKANGYDLAAVGKCETDCSAFMTVCAIAAGVTALEYSGNAPTTSTMRAKFTATGEFSALTASKYLTGTAYLKRGDILVAPGKHTVMVLDNGSAAQSGAGAANGGSVGKDTQSAQKADMASLRGIQAWCGVTQDGIYGPKTKAAIVRKAQAAIGVTTDGIFGAKSKAAWRTLRRGNAGNAVKAMQAMLICRGFAVGPDGADGDFGQNTENAVRGFQNCAGIGVDGLCGKVTAYTLFR